ncbi:MAG TPA: outer membrane beta-barrel protein [Sphingomonas sp.]|jgi:outer membrane immunogenic protein|nr:outer membrane beta-barrel protein [Sphingomonas sp.]
MRNLLIAGVAALALASPALAQDDEPQYFDGFYIGGHFGATFQPNDTQDTLVFSRGGAPFSTTLTNSTGANAFSPGFCNGAATSSANVSCANDRDNFDYGGRIGADARFGNIVIGIVGEGGRNESIDSTSAFSTTPASYTLVRDFRWNANVRGRLGYTPGTNSGVLFYATGGAAYARVRDRFFTTNTANSFAVSGAHGAWGWVAGGGVEGMITPRLSLGMEYLYSSYNDKKSRVLVGPGSAAATNPFILGGTTTTIAPSRNDLNAHGLRVTAAFHF